MSSVSHLICVSLVLLFASMVGKACAVQELVTLITTERARISHQAEWITIGVPLPKGKIRSTKELCVLQNNRSIAAEILQVNRWWDGRESSLGASYFSESLSG